jgi:hypothetical protein
LVIRYIPALGAKEYVVKNQKRGATMKTRLSTLLTILLWGINIALAGDFCVYEANYPGVKDYNVRVDTASLTILPRGAYIELDLELTISYDFKSWFFKNYNELEFLWQFNLPDQAVVTDFWLWVGDSILIPTIMDKWTAELLFSEVSSPVRNPGLLIQSFPDREGQVAHSLRIYPIMRNEKRKFKIHYLLPARPTNETLRLWLPTSQLTSRLSPGTDSLKIIFFAEQKPVFIGATHSYEIYHPEIHAWEFKIGLDYDCFVELVYPTPITGKHFFSTYADGNETFYQLALYPPEVQQQRIPRNFLILVDFNRFNTDGLDGELVLLLLKETMQQALSPLDSANIIVSYDDLTYGADRLLACSEANIDHLFENVLQRSFPSYSNFQVLMAAAVDFVASRYDSIDIILFTNTDEISLSTYSKEALADQIIAMFSAGTKIHIVDLENKSNLVYNYDLSQYETQLQSFFARICYQSAGNLFFLRYHSIKNVLAALFYEMVSHFDEVEVQIRLASGYAYGKHFIDLHEGYYPFKFPIMQTGRFQGSLSLDITILGKIQLQKVIDTFTITDPDVVPGVSSLMTSWYGDQIHQLLKKPQINATILDIMDISLKQNILTPYTGFLIFRPEDNHGYQEAEDDPLNRDGEWTNIDTARDDTSTAAIEFEAYPNPFNEAVALNFTVPVTKNSSKISLTIYNYLGQKVEEFKIDGNLIGRQQIIWNGKQNSNAISSGVYFAVLSGYNWKKTMKLVLIK